MSRISWGWRRLGAALMLLPALAMVQTPARAADAATAPPPITAVTWNLCGDGLGVNPADGGYCPVRGYPQKKADAVKNLVDSRGANAVLLQEVCAGDLNSDKRGPSLLDMILQRLGSGWEA